MSDDGMSELNAGMPKPWGRKPPPPPTKQPSVAVVEPKIERPKRAPRKRSSPTSGGNGTKATHAEQPAVVKGREPRQSDEDRLVIYLPPDVRAEIQRRRGEEIIKGDKAVTTTEMVRRLVVWGLEAKR